MISKVMFQQPKHTIGSALNLFVCCVNYFYKKSYKLQYLFSNAKSLIGKTKWEAAFIASVTINIGTWNLRLNSSC
jgi:hypothetical protein